MALIKTKYKRLFSSEFFRGSLVVIAMMFFWTMISQTEWAGKAPNNLWFAKIDEVTSAILEVFSTEEIGHITSTLILILKSTILVIIFGTMIGVVIGFVKPLYGSLKLSIDFWRSIPPIIIIPILVYWDQSPNESYWRIALVLFGCLPIMIMLIADAINSASKDRLLIFKSINTSFWFRVRNVIFYEVLPNIFSGARTVISFAIVIIIVSEMVLAPEQGVGRQIAYYKSSYEPQFVYAYAIIIGLIGMALNKAIRILEKKLIYWG